MDRLYHREAEKKMRIEEKKKQIEDEELKLVCDPKINKKS
jgi:hypothetical protein